MRLVSSETGEEIILSEEQIDHIAERAAEVALEKVYTEIGKSVVKKFLWVVGLITLSAVMWMIGTGKIAPTLTQ